MFKDSFCRGEMFKTDFLMAISLILLTFHIGTVFANEISAPERERLVLEAAEHEKIRRKTNRIFEAAKSKGAHKCREYLGAPGKQKNVSQFGRCVMWTAFHRKVVDDCKELKKVQDWPAPEVPDLEMHYYRCVAVVAARTKDSKLCKSHVVADELEKCHKYSESEVDVWVWGQDVWNAKPQG